MRTILAFGLFLVVPAFAWAQTKEELDEQNGKVSNDSPSRPLQMPPASSETKEAIEDFDRFQRRGAWERALKALYNIPDDQARRFIDGEQGFIIPIERKRRLILAALPPNGQAACRLLYDAQAKKLLDEANGPLERPNLEKVYSAYFITSVGDNAADRLGDLYFEQGQFDRAADCWLAVLRERPDTDLQPALLSVKAAVALLRAGRRLEYDQLRAELADRHGDDKIALAGQTGTPTALLDRLIGDSLGAAEPRAGAPQSAAAVPALDLTKIVDPAWQIRIGQSIEAGMTPTELEQWVTNPLSAAVPAVAIEGTKLYANFLGSIFAVDLPTGKLLWRTSSFHNLESIAMQDMARMVDPARFGILAAGDYVWTITRDLKDQNFFEPFQMICRRSDNGEVVWRSADLAEYADFDLVGYPLLAGGKLLIVAKTQGNNPQQQQGQPKQLVLGVEPHDGKLLWKADIGNFRQGNQYYYYYYTRDTSPQPRLVYRAGAVYVDTHVGVLARIDAETGVLEWGYGYQTDPVKGQSRFFIIDEMMQSDKTTASSPPLESGEAFLVKGAQSGRLYSVEPNRMKVLWDRPIAKSARMLGLLDQTLFLGGPELSALDLGTRQLLWATRVPGGSTEGRVLVRTDGLWQFTPRGVFELDPKTGHVRRIFRGDDLGAAAGDLFLSGTLLVTVSNRAISAYPRGPAAAGGVTARPEIKQTTDMERASR